MSLNQRNAKTRVLDEMMEMAHALHKHDLLSKPGMAITKLLCEAPPEYTPEKVTAIRVEKAKASQSALASILNVSVSAAKKWEGAVTALRSKQANTASGMLFTTRLTARRRDWEVKYSETFL